VSRQFRKAIRCIAERRFYVAMLGNPNVGKTALFDSLTGLRAKTANFPGITGKLRREMIRQAGETI